MAHELFPLLKLLETFGGDNFRHNGVVHQMSKYADLLRKFIGVEVVLAATAASEFKEVLKETFLATEENVKDTIKEIVSKPIDPIDIKLDAEHKDDGFVPKLADASVFDQPKV